MRRTKTVFYMGTKVFVTNSASSLTASRASIRLSNKNWFSL